MRIACCLFLALAILAVHASPANAAAPGPLTRAPAAGTTGTYTQINTTSNTFTLTDSNITILGVGGQLNTNSRPGTIYLDNHGGDTTLTLGNGALSTRNIYLRTSGQYAARLYAGSTGSGGTVTINGAIRPLVMGAGSFIQSNTSIQTSGADLTINGQVGASGPLGELAAASGNITINSSIQAQIYKLSARGNNWITGPAGYQLVFGALDLRDASAVHGSSLHIYNQLNGGVTDGATLHSNGDIWFMDSWSPGQGGMINGGGEFSATTHLLAVDHTTRTHYPLLQGAGRRLQLIAATGDIGASELHADVIMAEQGAAVSGGAPDASRGDISISVAGGEPFAPTGKITTSKITARKIAAGQLDAASARNEPASVVATENLLVVKNPASSGSAGNGNLTITDGTFTLNGSNPVGAAGYDANGATFSRDEANYIGGDMTVRNSGESSFSSLGVGGALSISGGGVEGQTLNAASVELKDAKAKIGKMEIAGAASATGGSLEVQTLGADALELKNGVQAKIDKAEIAGAVSAAGGSLEGQTLKAETLELKDGVHAKIDKAEIKGSASAAGGSLEAQTLGAGSVELKNGVQASIASLAITGASGALSIGSSADTAASTSASIASLTLNGRDLRVGAGAGQAAAAVGKFAVAGVPGNLIDGEVQVGHNGLLALGAASPDNLRALAAKEGVPASAAVLGVFSPVVLGKGLNVDAGWDNIAQGRARSLGRAAAGAAFSANSFLAVDGSSPGVAYSGSPVPTASLPAAAPGAISSAAPAAATVADGARIYLDRVTPGHTYVVLGKNIATSYAGPTAWKGANLSSSNPLLGLDRLENGMEGQFGVVEKAPEIKRISASGGVARMARAASEAMETAIFHRIKIGEEDLYRRSFALWALPIYESIRHFGLDAGPGSYGYDGGIGGLAVGGDYTWQNTIRLGFALNIGAGYARSHGDAVTKNNLDFWGLGAYAVWKPGQFSLDADLNFTWTYDKLKQELPADVSGSDLKADATSWSMGAGLRAQYEFDTEWLIIRPHFGFRYFHLDSAPYDVKLNGHDVLRAHRSYQNVWTFPFGIVFTKNFQRGDGYELTPLLNLKAIPASGDIYVKNSVIYAGAHQGEELSTQVMDSITYGGRAGLEFRAGDFSVGVNYAAQFGSHTTNQSVFGVLRYEF